MQGFINVFKPTNVTSAYVVNKIRKHFNLSKVGHMGTLDPMACGVLPIAIGKATKMFNYYLDKTKTYEAIFTFGYKTNTLDALGEITEKINVIPSLDQVKSAVKLFIGKYNQMPPQFSAKKINGEKAYNLARNNIVVSLQPKEIEIFKFNVLKQVNDVSFKFLIECSSGTYIRSLCNDLAKKLNSLATMTYLERTQSGFFNKNNSLNLEEILNKNSIQSDIIKIEDVFLQIESIYVNIKDFNKLLNGVKVEIDKPFNGYKFIKHNETLLGLGVCENNFLKIETNLIEN
jgi:tRNA pseudouridine55 synthase